MGCCGNRDSDDNILCLLGVCTLIAAPFLIIITLLLLALPFFLIVVGIVQINGCPVQPSLPIWMIVTGAAMLLERIFSLYVKLKMGDFQKLNPKPVDVDDPGALEAWEESRKKATPTVSVILTYIIIAILFVSFILGCIWSFGIYNQSDQCNWLVFWTTFLMSIIGIITICLYLIVLCLATAGTAYFLLRVNRD